jgi:hypothetical protein
MSENQVGLMPSDDLGLVMDFVSKLRSNPDFRRKASLFLQGKDYSLPKVDSPFKALERRLSRRFCHGVIVDPQPREFTPSFLANAAQYNMKPVFLPGEDITQNNKFKKWVAPCTWFYEQVAAGKIQNYGGLVPTVLRRGWYLIDLTAGVDYTDGTQVLPSDPWASLVAELREQKLVGKGKGDKGSRFAITWDEWNDIVLTYMASKLLVPRANIRLERAIEFNAIGNLYDTNRGQFNVWEWFSDRFEDSSRLYGGSRRSGGLAHVSYDWSVVRYGGLFGRPLVSF